MIGQLLDHGGCNELSHNTKPSVGCDEAWAFVFYLAAGLFGFGGLQFVIFGGMDRSYRRDKHRAEDNLSVDTEARPLLAGSAEVKDDDARLRVN